jgi:hypothetical protein
MKPTEIKLSKSGECNGNEPPANTSILNEPNGPEHSSHSSMTDLRQPPYEEQSFMIRDSKTNMALAVKMASYA